MVGGTKSQQNIIGPTHGHNSVKNKSGGGGGGCGAGHNVWCVCGDSRANLELVELFLDVGERVLLGRSRVKGVGISALDAKELNGGLRRSEKNKDKEGQ